MNYIKSSLDPSLYPDIWQFNEWYDEWNLRFIEKTVSLLKDSDFNNFSLNNIPTDEFGVRHVHELPPMSAPECLRIWEEYRPDRLKDITEDMISITERIQTVGPDYQYPSHPDNYDKMLTIIVYVVGKDGTEFLGKENRKELAVEIPFKRNHGYFFFPDGGMPGSGGGTTWHRFHNRWKFPRATTVINIRIRPQFQHLLEVSRRP